MVLSFAVRARFPAVAPLPTAPSPSILPGRSITVSPADPTVTAWISGRPSVVYPFTKLRWISATPRISIHPGCPPLSASPCCVAFHPATHHATAKPTPLAAKLVPFPAARNTWRPPQVNPARKNRLNVVRHWMNSTTFSAGWPMKRHETESVGNCWTRIAVCIISWKA